MSTIHFRKSRIVMVMAFICLFSCQQKESESSKLGDLNIYIKTDQVIDSVFVSNITQDREFQFLPYSDTLHIKFNDSINDLYNIWFYSKGKQHAGLDGQLWLKGKNIIVKGTFNDGFKLDTIIGTDLHYKAQEFRAKLSELYKNKTDSTTIDNFLLSELKKNINSPLSIEMSQNYFFRNQGNREKIQTIYDVTKTQSDAIKTHLFNYFDKFENILTVNKIDISQFQFLNIKNELSNITLDSNKKHLIDFWFVNCPPCIKDHKLIKKEKLDLLKKHNVELVGISTDSDQYLWSNYLKNADYPWKNYRETNDYDNRLSENMLISVFPTYLLVDHEGNILKRSNAFYEIENFLVYN
ncbi:TlpA family protein disulfide reductase [Winogradskyella immobilis]|uniref:Thioredoxin family protein n=1 Tax=Winogradskyella immobilis TaxID=2816852 RepID=A0ABS8EKK0_9FLAO|nr:thioredoxin family protein [Winogradskyella immobilis]MCC1483095.1 thioredoxin family protein [Winogradskyella immobilis]MCG0015190.1 thioredoxin family protein [Winogradskyella immobilis]